MNFKNYPGYNDNTFSQYIKNSPNFISILLDQNLGCLENQKVQLFLKNIVEVTLNFQNVNIFTKCESNIFHSIFLLRKQW